MDNSNCYWCDYSVDKINTSEEGYYCTFNPEEVELCSLEIVCPRYIDADRVPEYLRHLINEYKKMEQWLLKLP